MKNLLSITLGILFAMLMVSVAISSCKKEVKPNKLGVYKSSNLGVGDIVVYFDGSDKGTIYENDIKYVPNCDQASINVLIPDAGTYSFKAVATDGSEWQQTIILSQDECRKINLGLSDRSKVPVTAGNLIFWEDSSTGCSVATNVTINGVTKQVTSFSTAEPACGTSGNAQFTLTPGSYSYTASCSGTTKSGTVTVVNGQCTPVKLSWGIVGGTGQAVFWETLASGCPQTTNVTINGETKQVSTFSSSTPQCGSAGNATFSLQPGSYVYTASCSGTLKTGTVSVYANQCSPIQIIWSNDPILTPGYNCANGSCYYVSNGAQYGTLVACQSSCANTNLSTITFINNAFTDMAINFNGATKIAIPGGNAVFSGTPGTSASGTAETSGISTQGTQVGVKLQWDLSKQFPTSGNANHNLSVGSDYFFLYMKNSGSSDLSPIHVNYGLQSATTDNIVIPNNGDTYRLGYYKAWSNTNVRAYKSGQTSYVSWSQGTHFNLPFTLNQTITLVNTN